MRTDIDDYERCMRIKRINHSRSYACCIPMHQPRKGTEFACNVVYHVRFVVTMNSIECDA